MEMMTGFVLMGVLVGVGIILMLIANALWQNQNARYLAWLRAQGLLTPHEMVAINATHLCPDCGTGSLLRGPEGGAGVMVRCDNTEICGVEFLGSYSESGGFLSLQRTSAPARPVVQK